MKKPILSLKILTFLLLVSIRKAQEVSLNKKEPKLYIAQNKSCGVNANSSICFSGEKGIIEEFWTPDTTIFSFLFGEIYPKDRSINQFMLEGVFEAGIGRSRHLSSLKISQNSALNISNFSTFYLNMTQTFTLAFWIRVSHNLKVTSSNKNIFTPILSTPAQEFEVGYQKNDGRLYLQLGSSSDKKMSYGLLQHKVWTYIEVKKLENFLKIFINGISDTVHALQTSIEIPAAFFLINGSNLEGKENFLLQNIALYADYLPDWNALSEDIPFVEEIPLGSIYLACSDCINNTICKQNFHICTAQEMYSWGLLIVRNQGWHLTGLPIFVKETPVDSRTKGLLICCIDDIV